MNIKELALGLGIVVALAGIILSWNSCGAKSGFRDDCIRACGTGRIQKMDADTCECKVGCPDCPTPKCVVAP